MTDLNRYKRPSIIDYFAQAQKSLSQRSPFDVEEALVQVPTLPVSCSQFLSRCSESRSRKHRKTHSESVAPPEQRPGTVWDKTEEYFRPLTQSDVELLSSIEADIGSYLRVPIVRNGYSPSEAPLGTEISLKEPRNVENTAWNGTQEPICTEEQTGSLYLPAWLLGSRQKVLAVERPFKKQKLQNHEIGFQKILSLGGRNREQSPSCKSVLCHVCNLEDRSDNGFTILQCAKCQVSVHTKCYGVEITPRTRWLCSWCSEEHGSVDRPCILCPNQSGALKPVIGTGDLSGKFAHLACCQWVPEVYVENTERMEPVANIEEVKNARWKSTCRLCRIQHGACIKCSQGTCRTYFHPLCARMANHKMEIWGRVGCENIVLSAFCYKHSIFQETDGGHVLQNFKDQAVSSHSMLEGAMSSLDQNASVRQENGAETCHVSELPASRDIITQTSPATGAHQKIVNADKSSFQNEDLDQFRISSAIMLLKKLVDHGKFSLSNLAQKIGISSSSLAIAFKDSGVSISHHWKERIAKWIWAQRVKGGFSLEDAYTNSGDARTRSSFTNGVKIPRELNMIRSFSVRNASICPTTRGTEGSVGSSPHELALRCRDEFNVDCDIPGASTIVHLIDKEIGVGDGLPWSHAYIHPLLSRRLSEAQICQTSTERKYRNLPQNFCADSSLMKDESQCAEHFGGATRAELMDLSPADEVEGEILYFQNLLLDQAMASNHLCGNLISKVIECLPVELDALMIQKWDALLVNHYLSEVKETKKRGRKERRHREAQAVLAAAAAAAASSSRVSRKDAQGEQSYPKLDSSGGTVMPNSQLVPWTKEKGSIESLSDASADPRYCDICKKGETVLNPVFVCANCKVAVHLSCYGCPTSPDGPWHCEPCEELVVQSRDPQFVCLNVNERSCSLCGGKGGALRRFADDQLWHAFCVEWLLDSAQERELLNFASTIELLPWGKGVCCVCHQKFGVCLKCSYGHCQNMFHPVCGRDSSFFMTAKMSGAKFQRKAYCKRHSLEQRKKIESQQVGPEELRKMKQIRVELERLRLLCERIIKREKLKKELVLCSHDVLASRRDCVAFSALVRTLCPPSDNSSESVTTSLKGCPSERFCSNAHWPDEVAVDSLSLHKQQKSLPRYLDTGQKTDDSSTFQLFYLKSPAERVSCSEKLLCSNTGPSDSRHPADEKGKSSKSRNTVCGRVSLFFFSFCWFVLP